VKLSFECPVLAQSSGKIYHRFLVRYQTIADINVSLVDVPSPKWRAAIRSIEPSRSKLAVLRVDCTRCQRKSRYSIRRLIEQ
jgi:hypothetical protein